MESYIGRKINTTNFKFAIFLLLTFIHFVLILSIFLEIKYLFLIIIDLLFFVFLNFSLKKILRIITISLIFFILNILFYDGKIIYEFYFIKITKEGLGLSLKKVGVITSLFLFTTNFFLQNGTKIIETILRKSKYNLIIKSLNYFFYFLNLINNNNKISFKRIFLKTIYLSKSGYRETEYQTYNNYNIRILSIYNILFILTFLIISLVGFVY